MNRHPFLLGVSLLATILWPPNSVLAEPATLPPYAFGSVPGESPDTQTLSMAITREQAISIVIDSIIELSPYRDSMAGYMFQGTAPAGWQFQELQDLPGQTSGLQTVATATETAWFAWLDLTPAAMFDHPTKFILVSAVDGHILVDYDGTSWPWLFGSPSYGTVEARCDVPSRFWIRGVPDTVAAPAPVPPASDPPGPTFSELLENPPALIPRAAGEWAIIISPDSQDNNRKRDVERMIQVFQAKGVPNPTVVQGADSAATAAAIQGLPNDCAKLYVYWTGHAKDDWFQCANKSMYHAWNFACDLRDNNASEYCIIIDTCYASEFYDNLVTKGCSGFYMGGSDTDVGMNFLDPAQNPAWSGPFVGSWFTYYLAECLADSTITSDAAAFDWADARVRATKDSLLASPDSSAWKPHLTPGAASPSGGWFTPVPAAGGGVGASGGGGSFGFGVAQSCSTVCINVTHTQTSGTPTGGFSAFCQNSIGTWQKVGSWNWTVGDSIYFHTLPGGNGIYNISNHANQPGLHAFVTWKGGTTTPETPSVSNFNAWSIGWVDASGAEFSPTLGQGTNGLHSFAWVDGLLMDQIPAFTGPEWFQQLQVDVPIDPDFDHLEIYQGFNPALGFVEESHLILVAASLQDPFGGPPPPNALVEVTAFQPSLGAVGPFLVEFETGGAVARSTPWAIPPASVNLGTIFPEPLTLTLTALGPGVVEWDAIVMLPGEGVGLDAPDVPLTRLGTRVLGAMPNPFRPSTMIRFELGRRSPVRLDVFDVHGRRVTTLLNESRPAGSHAVSWDGRTGRGRSVGSGVYFYRLEADGQRDAGRVVRLR